MPRQDGEDPAVFEQKMGIKLQRPDFRRVWLGSRAKRKLIPIEVKYMKT